MDKSNDERQTLVTPNTTDDESLTTSTASDSWTLITDKKHPKTTIRTTSTYEEESHVEDLPKYEDLNLETSETTVKEEQEDEPSPDHHADTTSVTDEFSDEVSIISESENGDVLTPHPHLRELMHNLNSKFTTGEGLDFVTLLRQKQQQQEYHRLQEKQRTPPNTPIQLQQRSSNQIRQRKRRSPSIDETLVTAPVGSNSQSSYLIKRVYTLLFYLIVVLTSLGLYGKLFPNEWPLFSRNPDTNINTLEKKIIDMELQNNLMRAEIDLLSKQVNYLKTTNPNQNGDKNEKRYQANKEKKQYFRDERNFNREPTWSTQNNAQNQEYVEDATELPNIEITNDLPNNILSKIDSTPQTPNIEFPEEVPTTTENNKQAPSKKFHDDNNVIEEHFHKHKNKEKSDSAAKSDGKYKKRNESDEKFKQQNKKYNSKERFDHDADDDDDDDDDDDNSKERKHFKTDSKERYHERNSSKERKYKRDDNENKRYNKQNSKEEYRGNENFKKFGSKEYQHQKRRNAKSGEKYDNRKDSGEWHEKLMQHREKSRIEQEERQKREKNWYLNRNDAREQLRIDEMNRR